MKNKTDLSSTLDAKVWAKEFVRLHGGDEELMVTWFANAIMAGYDGAKKQNKDGVPHPFTGRKDDEGFRINEGDFCRCSHPNYTHLLEGKVIWDNELSLYGLKTEDGFLKLYELDGIKVINDFCNEPVEER
ncbi:MAG: hypothetical protein V3U97_05420 [bacterium]